MSITRPLSLIVAMLLPQLSPGAIAATCSARSGPERATLIELYTSEGCNSCPPADRWLSGFAHPGSRNASPVVLAFHVDYWDQLGWRDRFATPAFTARQYRHLRANGGYAYTPQTVVDGRDSTAWRQAAGPGQVGARTAAVAAGADLKLDLASADNGRLTVELEAIRRAPANAAAGAGAAAVAYLALYENGLASSVSAGENAGQRLRHDFVVRQWAGPFPLKTSGITRISHGFEPRDVVAANAGVAAIVETGDGSAILQALALPLCGK